MKIYIHGDKKNNGEAAVSPLFLSIECIHYGLKLCYVFSRDWRFVVIIVGIEEHREHVGHGLALGVAHDIPGGVGTFGNELMLQSVALTVASDDTTNLPEAEVVEKLTAGDAYLAHEKLVDVVGGCQFFAFLPFPFAGFSSGSPLGML